MKKYQIIYADPPWDFSHNMWSAGKGGYYKKTEEEYQVMSTIDICKLPVKEITDKDCILFLWTTDAHLPDALKVIESWRFEYKTIGFYWLKKEKSGKQVCYMGCWTMKCGEICLLATKGKMLKYLKVNNIRQLVEASRNKNSQKPDEVRNRIVKMFGNLPRIELFARQKTEGWDCLGNEISGKDINDELTKQ